MWLVGQLGIKCRIAGSIVFLLSVTDGQAHMLVEGAGDFGNGALHPFLTPAHGLVLLGFALLLGQQVPFRLKWAMRGFAGVSALALACTTLGKMPEMHPAWLVALALCMSALVAIGRQLPSWVLAGLGGLAAAGIGLDSGFEPTANSNIAKMLLGNWASMNVATFYLAICASHGANKQWAQTGIRVLGSWIIAISLLVLAFSLKR